MPPPKKRLKAEPPKEEPDSGSGDVPVSIDSINKTLDLFVQNIGDAGKASEALLSVKGLQRGLLTQLEEVEEELDAKYKQVDKHRNTLANLDYEQGHWEAKIQHHQDASKTPQLEALCREELDDNLTDGPAVIYKFLKHDITLPDHESNQVTAILQQQIHQRGILERDVNQRNRDLKNQTGLHKAKAKVLHQLPEKLKELEKASLPLQRFFATTLTTKGDSEESGQAVAAHATFNTSERETRLMLARQLPGPLYTLLVQLQSYIDDYPARGMTLDVGTCTAVDDILWKDPDERTVVLQIPVPPVPQHAQPSSGRTTPTLVGGKKDKTGITFTYFPAYNVVTAKTSGSEDRFYLNSLLQLNPHDTGDYQVKGDMKTTDSSCPYGKPYLWSNYLAGLQLVKGQSPMELLLGSTRVIVAELLRRLQANMVLFYILHRVFPSQPRGSALPPFSNRNKDQAQQCLARIASFQVARPPNSDSSTADEDTKTYTVQLKRGNHSFKATVIINLAQYPVLAPQWSLTGNDLDWGQDHGSHGSLHLSGSAGNSSGDEAPPLHEARLGELENRVNDIDQLIKKLKEEDAPISTEEDGEKEENGQEEPPDESYFYDWILTHQMREIILEWDAWVAAETDGSAGNSTRTVRGRDRAKVE